MDDLQRAASEWQYWKQKESEAVERRREAEDKLSKMLAIDATVDASKTHKHEGVNIKVTTRLNHRIDSGELQTLALEHGISEHLSSLFNWRPSISAKAWKAADPAITSVLSGAITTTAGRPSYKIDFE